MFPPLLPVWQTGLTPVRDQSFSPNKAIPAKAGGAAGTF
jgi:hypothetical protein